MLVEPRDKVEPNQGKWGSGMNQEPLRNEAGGLSRLILAIALICLSFGPGEVSGQGSDKEVGPEETGGASTTSDLPTEQNAAQAAESARYLQEKFFPYLEDLRRQIPSDRFEANSLARSLGDDMKASFEWVRDRTALVPYQGCLKGAEGVLLERRGNSLDRSLLLGTLLEAQEKTIRLARAKLEEGDARRLLDERTDPEDGFGEDSFSLEGGATIESIAEKHGLPVDETEEADSADPIAFAERLQRLSLETRERLEELLPRPLGQTGGAAPVAELEAFQDHWWVQVEEEGRWIDLDTGLPGHEPGDRLREAEATLAWGVPEEMEHRVILRLVGAYTGGGETKTETFLTQEIIPRKYPTARLVIAHSPKGGGLDVQKMRDISPEDTGQALLEAARGVKGWIPFLTVDEQTFAGKEIEVKRSGGTAGGGGGFGGLAGAFSKAFNQNKPDTYLSGEWLELEVRVPGSEPLVHRREIFDLLGSPDASPDDLKSAERSLSFLSRAEIHLATAYPDPAYVMALSIDQMIGQKQALLGFLLGDSLGVERFVKLEQENHSISPRLLSLAQMRHLLNPDQGETFIPSTNIFLEWERFDSRESEIRFQQILDVVDHSTGVRASGDRSAPSIRQAQGVLDTFLEAAVLSNGVRPTNTALKFHETEGESWRVLTSPEDVASLTGVPDRERRPVREALESGAWAVVPGAVEDQAGALTWWKVNPETGETLGMGARGEGSAGTEQAIIITKGPLTFIVGASVFSGTGSYVSCHGGTGTSGTASWGKIMGCGLCAVLGAFCGGMGATAAIYGGGPVSGSAAGRACLGVIIPLSAGNACNFFGGLVQ